MTPWTVAHQAPLSTEFSRQGYWSGLPFPSPGDLTKAGIKPDSPALQADSLPTELQGMPKSLFLFCFLFFGYVTCGILVPQPGNEPVPPAVS